MLKFKESEAEV